jgi:Arc/MetJ-type ribon-helix-helix transcriptional regulator
MKVSVSLPDEDIEFIDDYAKKQGMRSRSSALHRAIAMLRASELGGDYADAFAEWEESGDARAWEPVVGDGVS